MPLEPYLRGRTWWAKGRVEYNDAPITDYYRCSTGTSSEQAAREWCRAEEKRQLRRFLVGPEEAEEPLTFAAAVLLHEPDAKTAGYLIPIVELIGEALVSDITPKIVRELGPILYPDAGTKTWARHVVTPIRSVINNAHDLGKCPPIKIKGYTAEEQVAQDRKRGSRGRTKYKPGSWEWLLQFRAHATQRVAALALTMFVTGARISQAVQMNPGQHLDLDNNRICIPGAKGHDDRWIEIPKWLAIELKNLQPGYPRGAERKTENLRVFGYADRSSPRKDWNKAIEAADIEYLPFHSAGRHGFGQEMNVRQSIDEKAAGAFGGWSDTNLMRRTYTHAEDEVIKVHRALETGLKRAQRKTKLKLVKAAK
ncbi:integrase [Croceicoccus estronivorus]|uniref:tyrosine-type recombinase/integrase n=1 Tax=Croceicoccus estronivorus TaxID=1172626 RepID=UPI000833A392|nr:tyrosine-type recombinase/integrase [Croceicoccus estronivorus]OCC25336.1 integrase [Croceicoccus estronivorus]